MVKRKKILLENAWAAWRKAIYYCNAICEGRATLDNRKSFVSALHNAVELFLKQIMLDQNDHRVATPKRLKDAECKLARDYYSADNLNEYFELLELDELNKFYSIEFNEFIHLHKKILVGSLESNCNYKKELELLAHLRNAETHFYVNDRSYLDDNEFIVLHNFMVKFNAIISERCLLPFWGEPRKKDLPLRFKRKELDSFSYRDTILNARAVKIILNDSDSYMVYEDELDSYEIAEFLKENIPDLEEISFNIIWEYIQVLQSLD